MGHTMPLLSEEEIRGRLDRLERWAREGDALRREFRFRNFVESVEFVDRLVPVAEELNHHPDLDISWNRVRVSLTTHAQGGITLRDFELAARIDSMA